MAIVPGLLLALVLAVGGQFLSDFIGIELMGLPKSPISAIMMAILLGIVVRNTITLPAMFDPGIRFGLVRVLRLGIVLLGIRLRPRRGGRDRSAKPARDHRRGRGGADHRHVPEPQAGPEPQAERTLLAVGTSICGATAIVATAPTIGARDDEVAYAVACVTLFGVIAMLVYPFAAHSLFGGDPFASGLFLGTSVHETAQVAGSGLVYQQYYGDPAALDTATVTKLVRNLGMLIIIPLMSVVYHRNSSEGTEAPKWWTMIPLFVVGFACMSLLRTVGDLGDPAFGFIPAEQWHDIVDLTKKTAEICLAVAMAAVGLGTSIKGLVGIGLKPLAMGLVAALLVGGVSASMITLLY